MQFPSNSSIALNVKTEFHEDHAVQFYFQCDDNDMDKQTKDRNYVVLRLLVDMINMYSHYVLRTQEQRAYYVECTVHDNDKGDHGLMLTIQSDWGEADDPGKRQQVLDDLIHRIETFIDKDVDEYLAAMFEGDGNDFNDHVIALRRRMIKGPETFSEQNKEFWNAIATKETAGIVKVNKVDGKREFDHSFEPDFDRVNKRKMTYASVLQTIKIMDVYAYYKDYIHKDGGKVRKLAITVQNDDRDPVLKVKMDRKQNKGNPGRGCVLQSNVKSNEQLAETIGHRDRGDFSSKREQGFGVPATGNNKVKDDEDGEFTSGNLLPEKPMPADDDKDDKDNNEKKSKAGDVSPEQTRPAATVITDIMRFKRGCFLFPLPETEIDFDVEDEGKRCFK